MSVRVPHRSLEQEADDLASANYDLLKSDVLRAAAGKLRAEGITTLNQADLEDAYQQGWHGVCQHIVRGKPVTSLDGLLYVIVHRRALDIYRQKHERRRADVNLEQTASDVDLTDQVDNHLKLKRLMSRLQARLNDNERKGITLCVLHGYKRPEAADVLGIDRVVFERIMDGATKKMSAVIASIEARGCGGEEWSRALRAYALGGLPEDEHDYRRVHDHVDGARPCDSCRRYVRGLQGLSLVLPPLLLPSGTGHDASLLGYLHRLFGSGHAAASGTSATLQSSTAAGTTAVGSTATGGMSALLGGGAIKAAVVAAGIAAAGSLALHPTPTHQARRHATIRTHLSPIWAQQSDISAAARAHAISTQLIGDEQNFGKPRPHARPSAPSSAVATEFGFEASQPSVSPSSARPSSNQQPTAAAALVGHTRHPNRGTSSQLGFEHVSSSTSSRAPRVTSAEFGFEHAP